MTEPTNLESGVLFGCKGLVAVVTGGGTGLGATMARALARNGASVFILGRRLEKLEEVVSDFEQSQPPSDAKIMAVRCDAADKSSLEAAVKTIEQQVGYVNLLVANAGILGPTHKALARTEGDAPLTLHEVREHLWKTPMDDFMDVYRVNVAGAHFTTVAFLDLLDKGNKRKNVKQTSQVVVVSSIGGFHRNWMNIGMAYVTSKAATTHLIKNLASFLIQFDIRVNGIAPGIFITEINALAFEGRDMTQEGSLPKNVQPMTRSGRDSEIAGTILYLASEAGAYCSGAIQILDGGRLGVLPGTTY